MNDQMQHIYDFESIANRISTAMDSEEEAAEIVEYLCERLDSVAPQIRNYLQYLEDHAAVMKKRASVFQYEARKADQFRELIRDKIKETMLTTGMMDIPPFKLSAGAHSLDEEPGAELPLAFCDIITEYKLRKSDLKSALKNGEAVPGYSLKPVFTLRTKP